MYRFSPYEKNQTGQCNEKVCFFRKILLPFDEKGDILLEETERHSVTFFSEKRNNSGKFR